MEFFKKLFGNKSRIDWEEVKQSLETKVSGLRRPAVRLVKTSKIGRSKFGGRPFVDMANFDWPRSGGKPMAFLAQIELSEISRVCQYDWLGNRGLLLFFYDVIEMPWGFDPKDRGKWCVLYQSEPNGHSGYPTDLDGELKIRERYIEPKLVELLPNFDDPSVDQLGLSDEEMELYINLAEGDEEPSHQVGGFPSPVQGNYMALESQLASNGVYVGNPDGYKSERAKQLASGEKDWRLLFQFDSDEDLDIMWGDCGMIYFWVQEERARSNEFDNSWLVLQCC